MSTLEKFGILVILILVVIIGVVAVWGVGGEEKSPFEAMEGGSVASADDAPKEPAPWPAPSSPVNPGPASDGSAAGPVQPPSIQSPVTQPAGPVTAGALDPAAGTTTYRIRKGDTLARIAKEFFGDPNRWRDLVAANPGLDPRRLKIGQEIRIPAGTAVAGGPVPKPPVKTLRPNPDDGPTGPLAPPSEAVSGPEAPAPAGGREVEVRPGDTLYEIARRELGDPNLYFRIIAANPGIDPKRLRPGQRIHLPVAE